jgi:hypothetical protein
MVVSPHAGWMIFFIESIERSWSILAGLVYLDHELTVGENTEGGGGALTDSADPPRHAPGSNRS